MSGAAEVALGSTVKRPTTPLPPRDAVEPISPISPIHQPRDTGPRKRRRGEVVARGLQSTRLTRINRPANQEEQDSLWQSIWQGLENYAGARVTYSLPTQPPIASLASNARVRERTLGSPTRTAHSPENSLHNLYELDRKVQVTQQSLSLADYTETGPPSKRARSEIGASPEQYHGVPRPATSHFTPSGWSYNLEHAIDNGTRIGQSSRPTSSHARQPVSSASASDAELLLGFSRSARTPSVSTSRDQTSPTFLPSVLSPGLPSAPPTKLSAASASPQLYSTYNQTSSTINGFSISQIPPFISNPVNTSDFGSDHDNAPANSASVTAQTHTPPQEKDTAEEEEEQTALNSQLGHALKEPPATVDSEQGAPKTQSLIVPGAEYNISHEGVVKSVAIGDGSIVSGNGEPYPQLHSPRSPSADSARVNQANAQLSVPNAGRNLVTGTQHEHDSRAEPGISPTTIAGGQTSQTGFNGVSAKGAKTRIEPTTIQAPPNAPDVCAECKLSQTSSGEDSHMSWIHCSGCKLWHHYACAGISTDKEAKLVDKFFCKRCTPSLGRTTYLRKSARAHNDVDYASLNMGVIRTSDDNPEHHWIKAIKNGSLQFKEEAFMRLAPELVTAEFFEKTGGWTEPVVIPASMNPRPLPVGGAEKAMLSSASDDTKSSIPSDRQFGTEHAPDDGQDMLDMVIPQGLTVRRVAELHGPNQQLDVIDVKEQDSGTRMTLQKWADYYESSDPHKPIRNVISLEVSHSRLGRLIRRPKVVRDLDLQDAVWPAIENGKVNPRASVAFYCLMSVADCYTDFHIDFGGSSVYYHIVKGKKTFFFIPPTPRNLSHYQDWCNSGSQSSTFLGTLCDQCYRVDLSEGDTMLIPAGWIHAVWTPEDSLVIGGNFLTRLNYSMQFNVVEIEKATKVPRKFRYPMFQKVMWYTLLAYLKDDPLPESVAEAFYAGSLFKRNTPTWRELDKTAANSTPGAESYQARYYSKSELDGTSQLASYLFRTVMISMGRVEGVAQDTVKAVTKSIPKGYGSPLKLVKTFAMWIAWKRGNENIPLWAHPDAELPEQLNTTQAQPKKFTSAQLKKMEQAAAIVPSQHNMRLRNGGDAAFPSSFAASPVSVLGAIVKTPKTSILGPKRVACDACRRRRTRCKHKDDEHSGSSPTPGDGVVVSSTETGLRSTPAGSDPNTHWGKSTMVGVFIPMPDCVSANGAEESNRQPSVGAPTAQSSDPSPNMQALAIQTLSTLTPQYPGTDLERKGRSQACETCRKSKRRCIHNTDGTINVAKAAETPVPRGSASSKKRLSKTDNDSPSAKRSKKQHISTHETNHSVFSSDQEVNDTTHPGSNYPLDMPNYDSLRLQPPTRSVYHLDPLLDGSSRIMGISTDNDAHSKYQQLASAALGGDDPAYKSHDGRSLSLDDRLGPSLMQADEQRSSANAVQESHHSRLEANSHEFLDPALEQLDNSRALDAILANGKESFQTDVFRSASDATLSANDVKPIGQQPHAEKTSVGLDIEADEEEMQNDEHLRHVSDAPGISSTRKPSANTSRPIKPRRNYAIANAHATPHETAKETNDAEPRSSRDLQREVPDMTALLSVLSRYEPKNSPLHKTAGLDSVLTNNSRGIERKFTPKLDIFSHTGKELPRPPFSPLSDVDRAELVLDATPKHEVASPAEEATSLSELPADGSPLSNSMTDGPQTSVTTPTSEPIVNAELALLRNAPKDGETANVLRKRGRPAKRNRDNTQNTTQSLTASNTKKRLTRASLVETSTVPSPLTSVKTATPEHPSTRSGSKASQKRKINHSNSRRNSKVSVPELPAVKTPSNKNRQTPWGVHGVDEANWRAIQDAHTAGLGLRARKGRDSL